MGDLSKDHEMVDLENRDRLSELPHSLILHILSFLPMNNVVSTTLLSKGWNNLWTTVPCLNISDFVDKDSGIIYDLKMVRNFVNRALMLWKGTKILKFTIDLNYHVDKSLFGDIDSWVRFAIHNKVEELCVQLLYSDELLYSDDLIKSSKEVMYWIPECLNSCSSIRKLSLVGCNLQLHGSPNWNQLKSLSIDGCCLSEHVINQILLGTPQLEVLVLCLLESYGNLNIRSSSLKKLAINKHCDNDDLLSMDTVLRIWCPNLETLKLSGFFYYECLLTNVSSLTAATLGLHGPPYDDDIWWKKLLGEKLMQIFTSIGVHVEKVTLEERCFQALMMMQKTYLLPLLSNVKVLKFSVSFINLNEIVFLFRVFPKLKMLVIKHTGFEYQNLLESQFSVEKYVEPETYLPDFFLLQLRTVEIRSLMFEMSLFPFIAFLLKHAIMLEKIVIRTKGMILSPPELLLMSEKKILSMPRSSPTAKLIILPY